MCVGNFAQHAAKPFEGGWGGSHCGGSYYGCGTVVSTSTYVSGGTVTPTVVVLWWQLLWLWYMCVVAPNLGITVLAFTDI